MIDNATEILLALVSVNFPADFGEDSFGNGEISSADFFIFNANVLITSVLIVAENGKAFRENNDGVSFHDISLGFVVGCFIKEISIVFVGDSWRTIVDDLNFLENVRVLDIDK